MRIISLFVVAGFLGLPSFAAPIELEPGKWDLIVTAKILGQNVSHEESECLKDEWAALEPEEVADLIEENISCEAQDLVHSPGALSLTLSCPGNPYHGTAFTGEYTKTSLSLEGVAPMGQIDVTGAHSGAACD